MGESSLRVILLCWSMLYFNWTANHTLHIFTHTHIHSMNEAMTTSCHSMPCNNYITYRVPKRQSSCQCWTRFRDTMLPRTHHIRVTIQAVIGFDLKTQALGHVGCFILAMLLLVGSWSCTVVRPQTLPANGNHWQHTRKNLTKKARNVPWRLEDTVPNGTS